MRKGAMSDFLSRARGLFRWPQVVSWGSWPIAIALTFSQVELAERYVPVPASFVDITFPFAFAGYLALKVLVGWVLLVLVVGVLPHLLWGMPLQAASLLSALFAVLLVTPRWGGLAGAVTLMAFLLAFLAVCWAGRLGADVERWLYRVVPFGVLGVCALGFLFLWAGHFPLRVLGGRNPILAAMLLAATAVVVLLPVLRRAPGRLFQLILLGATALFLSTQGAFVFEENYRLFSLDESSEVEVAPRHVILIVIDTLRADALDLSGPRGSSTPHLAALAAESVIFENAIAPSSWTYPSMVSLMTGVAPLRDSTAGHTYATARLPTLAQHFQRRGYYTRGIVGNNLLFRPNNVAAGFHRIETYATTPVGGASRSIGLADRVPERFAHGGSTRYITDQGIGWIKRNRGRPSFLWLHYFDPHAPYLPPVGDLPAGVSVPVPPLLAKPQSRMEETDLPRKLYDAEVRFVDREVGRFLAVLEQAGLYDDALIVVTSDHGEEFWEHGGTLHDGTMYQELLHVPFMIRLPGGKLHRRVRSRVPTQALLPTLLEVAGIETPPQPGWAPSLTPFLQQDSIDRYEAPIISGATLSGEFQWSVIKGRMKYIERRPSGLEEIYDLDADPDERDSVFQRRPDVAAASRRILEEHRAFAARTLQGLDSDGDERDDEWKERLRSLGYIE